MKPRFLIIIAFALVPLIVAGCNILAPASYIIEGTGTNPAEHELAPIKTLVFVDDQTNVLPRTALRANLADMISEDLLTRELVPETVDSTDAMAMVRNRERNGKRMSCEAIASEAGVKQLIFVEMDSFSLTQDGWIPRPNGSVSVKVFDFEKGSKSYPISTGLDGSGGRVVSVTMREVAPTQMRSTSGKRQTQVALIADLAKNVMKLFYEHNRTDLGENLGIR